MRQAHTGGQDRIGKSGRFAGDEPIFANDPVARLDQSLQV